jgi:uncharacterized SAM-binding protein YcdF (DUF218 family)
LVLVIFVILLTVFCAASGWLFVFPSTGMPAKVDAIVVPGGLGNRIDAALHLAKQDRARYLVLSEGEWIPPGLCGSRVGTASVICFMPDPDTTQGEARGTARLARSYGFRSIVLVTTPDQTWRAKLRFGRCYSGQIFAVTTPLPLSEWPFQIAYQWTATVKAEVVNRGC